jgi:hypothetical protein
MKGKKPGGPKPPAGGGSGGKKPPQPGGSKPSESGGGGNRQPQLSPEIQGKIGQQLRKIYDDVVSQGVPGRFVDLLDRLDKPKERR